MTARLLQTRDLTHDVREFVFETPEIGRFDFTPGQFVSFTSEHLGRPVTRAYSLASAPNGNRFEICLNRVREGLFSPWLFEMAPGDEVRMQGPFGYFTPKQPFHDAVFVATGTGIAPFRAFLQSRQVLNSAANVSLLFGARHESALLYRDLFVHLEATHPRFRFLPTITRPDANWTGRTGRVQNHLDEALSGRTGVDVYICGLKAMVDDIRTALKQRGFDRKQIVVEKFD